MDPTPRLPDDLVEHARAFTDGGREPVDARHASTVVLLRDGDGEPGGLEVYLLRRHVDMAFAGGHVRVPRRRGRQARLRRRDRLGRARPRPSGPRCSAPTRRSPGRWCAPRCGRRSRSPACCSPGRPRTRRRGHHRRGLGGGPARARGPRGLLHRVPRPSRPPAAHRPAAAVGLLGDAGVRAAPVQRRFFVAELPAGQVTRDVSTESDHVVWLPVREAIRGRRRAARC